MHTNISATVFWIGEPVGNGSTEDNALSAYDDAWLAHYGGVDDPEHHRMPPYFPPFTPGENPFYLDLPYSDFTSDGKPRPDRVDVVPWASELPTGGDPFSLMKNRWVRIRHQTADGTRTCYGQIEDAGPYVYDDADYVFGSGDPRPRNRRAHDAGMDVSPALRDCLGFNGLNNDANQVDWQFVDAADVPDGPWRQIVTTRQIYWP